MRKARRPARPTTKPIPADSGAEIRRQVQRVNVDFPLALLRELDREAARIGVARQALIKIRVADALPPTKAPR